MIEAKAPDLLASFDGVGDLENWIAARRWKAELGGWTAVGELEGFVFRIEVVSGGLRLFATEAGSRPAVWEVPAQGL